MVLSWLMINNPPCNWIVGFSQLCGTSDVSVASSASPSFLNSGDSSKTIETHPKVTRRQPCDLQQSGVQSIAEKVLFW